MIDPRISLGVQTPNVTPAINLFNQAMQRNRQNEIQDQLLPGQLELQQQKIQSGKLNLQNEQDRQDLRSIAEFATLSEGQIQQAQDGNIAPLMESLTQRKLKLQSEGRNTEQTDELIATIGQGQIGTALTGLNNARALAQQTGLIGKTQERPTQFGAQQTFKDEKGNLFFGTQKRNPTTGEVQTAFSSVSADPNMQPQGQLSLVSGLGQTAQEKQTTEVETTEKIETVKANAQGKSSAIKAGVGQAVKAFEKIPLVTTAINNYQEAITALDQGANTGTIDQMLPSLNRASKELDNVVKRLGLDVVGNTTFGALSESELAFALKAAIPTNLEPAELKQWLTAKKNSQEKLLKGLNEMANFLGGGEKTIADWNNRQAVQSLAGGQASDMPATDPESQQPSGFKILSIE